MANLPIGDPFAPRNDFALEIDYEKEPPLIEINSHHKASNVTTSPWCTKNTKTKRIRT